MMLNESERKQLIDLLEEAHEKALIVNNSMNGGFGAWYADYIITHWEPKFVQDAQE